jgi:hypothetical protein
MRIGGSMANGGCGPVQNVNVPGPSRIVVHVSSTAVENGPPATGPVYTRILNSSGGLLASGPTGYLASGPGSYGVQVCSAAQSANPAKLQYNGEITIAPPTASTAVHHSSTGAAATKVPTKLAGRGGVLAHGATVWFTVDATKGGGPVSLRVSDAQHGVHMIATSGLTATFAAKRIEISGKGMTLTLTLRGAMGQQHVVFHSRGYSVSGNVVRGGILAT